MRSPKFFGTKFGKMILIAAACLFVAFWSPSFVTFSLHQVFGAASAPFQSFFSFLGFQVRGATSFFGSIGTLKRDNERLTEENLNLTAENARLRDESKENELLRTEIGLLPRDHFSLQAAEVIGQEGGSFGSWVIINRGQIRDARVGMPVIIGNSVLIGRIIEVSALASKVALLSNSDSTTNAVDEATGARGIVRGEYGTGLTFDMVLQSDTLHEGDSIITSGLGGELPRGLLIGTVSGIRPSPDRLYQQASLVPPVRYRDLRIVFIIVGTSS